MEPAPAQSMEESTATYRSHFGIGGVSVQLAGRRSADVTLVPSLEPFRIETLVSDINIRVERVDRLFPPAGRQIFDSGTTWELHGSETEFQFDFNAAMFGDRPFKRLLIDRNFRRATLQMNEDCLAGYPRAVEPLGYPLDELLIMHRLTQENAIELHGVGIVGPNGVNNLFVGHSGAGKSTTARLWTSLHAVEILSDDRIIVRENVRENKMPEQAAQIFMYGTPWHGEAHFALPQRAPLDRICILEHGQGNILTRLSRSEAVAELFARAFVPFHHHEYVDHALSFLERLAGTIPCYRYSFEPDERAVERILNFRD
jgi:adenylate kinase family enzyme